MRCRQTKGPSPAGGLSGCRTGPHVRNRCGSSELPVLPAFAIKTWQISTVLDRSISTSRCAARKSQSIWPPASSISSTPPQTHTYPFLLVCFSARLPASPNPPAIPKNQSFSLLLCKLTNGWKACSGFNWIRRIHKGDYWMWNLIPR